MQHRIHVLEESARAEAAAQSGAGAGGRGTGPKALAPLVSWAEEWQAALQAHFHLAQEKARQRLERQAAVSKANLAHNLPAASRGPHASGPLGSAAPFLAGADRWVAGPAASFSSTATSVCGLGASRREGSSIGPEPGGGGHRGGSEGGPLSPGVGLQPRMVQGPPAAVPEPLLQQSQEAAAINAALQLLDGYSQVKGTARGCGGVQMGVRTSWPVPDECTCMQCQQMGVQERGWVMRDGYSCSIIRAWSLTPSVHKGPQS